MLVSQRPQRAGQKSRTKKEIGFNIIIISEPTPHQVRKDIIAARRVPCACKACLNQLNKAQIPHLPIDKQPRYQSNNTGCILQNILEELNNWIFISIVDTSSFRRAAISDINTSIFKSAMQSRSLAMVSVLEEGNYAAISTTDPNAISGYYIRLLTSNAHTLQDAFTTTTQKESLLENQYATSRGLIQCHIVGQCSLMV